MYSNLQIPQANTSGLFSAPNFSDTEDAAYKGFDRGVKLQEAYRQAAVKQKLRELIQKHDITIPQGKLALVKELSASGLAEEVMKMDQGFKSQAGQVLDTPGGYQIADPAYGRAHPMQGGGGLMGQGPAAGQGSNTEPPGWAAPAPQPSKPNVPGWAAPAPQPGGSRPETVPQSGGLLGGSRPGQGIPSHQSQKRIGEQELRDGFNVWEEHIAKPFAEARGHKYSGADINNLRSTLPKELRGQSIAEDYLKGLKVEPQSRSGGGSGSTNPSGIARNIEEIDSELGDAEQELQDLEANKPPKGSREWSEKTFKARNRITRLREERRRYQARGPAKAPAGARKLTDPNKAREYLSRAGGDKEKAREMAKREGWAF